MGFNEQRKDRKRSITSDVFSQDHAAFLNATINGNEPEGGSVMKRTSLILLTLGLMCCFSSLGFAESFDAIVTAVMDGGSSIVATITGEYGGETKKDVVFHLLPTVDLSDYKMIGKIKPGDRIKIQAEKGTYNDWEISKIEPYPKS